MLTPDFSKILFKKYHQFHIISPSYWPFFISLNILNVIFCMGFIFKLEDINFIIFEVPFTFTCKDYLFFSLYSLVGTIFLWLDSVMLESNLFTLTK